MAESLFTLDFKKLPKAFIAFLLILMLIETISSAVLKKLPSRHALQRVLNMIAKEKIGADILILGDSFALTAFYNKNRTFSAQDKLMSKLVSLASNADVTMAGQYFILERYLARNKPPKAVFLISTPFLWDIGLGKFSDNYFFSCFTNNREIMNILLTTKNPNFLIRMLYYKFLPSAQYSLYLAEFWGKSDQTRRQMLDYLKDTVLIKLRLARERPLEEQLAEINKPRFLVAELSLPERALSPASDTVPQRPPGSVANSIGPRKEELPKAHLLLAKPASVEKITPPQIEPLPTPKARLLSDEEFQARDRKFSIYYFDKMCTMLKEKAVKLYYVDASVTYSLFKEQGNYFISGRDFVKTLQDKQKNFIYLEDFTPLYFEDNYFFDKNHLNAVGAEYYLRIFYQSLQNLVQSLGLGHNFLRDNSNSSTLLN